MALLDDTRRPGASAVHVLFVTYPCYLDDSSGAAVASRALLEGLAREVVLKDSREKT